MHNRSDDEINNKLLSQLATMPPSESESKEKLEDGGWFNRLLDMFVPDEEPSAREKSLAAPEPTIQSKEEIISNEESEFDALVDEFTLEFQKNEKQYVDAETMLREKQKKETQKHGMELDDQVRRLLQGEKSSTPVTEVKQKPIQRVAAETKQEPAQQHWVVTKTQNLIKNAEEQLIQMRNIYNGFNAFLQEKQRISESVFGKGAGCFGLFYRNEVPAAGDTADLSCHPERPVL